VKRDRDRGESLLETMFAVVMLGLLVVTAVMAFTSVINEAIQYRMLASVNVILHNDVSEATTQLQNQANPLYATCATPAAYSASGTNAVRFTNQMAGYSSTITSVTYWDGSSFVATCPPIVGEPQPQQITVRVTSADGVMSDSSQFTVDNPYNSSQYPPDLAIAQLAFVQQPSTIKSLQTFSPSVQVAVEDVNGNVLTSDWSHVTMTVTPVARTNGGSLAACAGTEDQGVFTFPACTLDGGGQYELVATDQGITARSVVFNAIAQLDPPVVTAVAGAASQLAAVTMRYTPSDNAPSDQAYTGYACLDPQLDSNCTLVTPFASGGTISGLQSGQVYYVAVVATASQDYLDAVSVITSPVAATLQSQTPVITNVTGVRSLTVTFTDATIAPTPTYSAAACTDLAMSQKCVTVSSFTSGSTITGVTLGTSYYVTVALASQPGWLGAVSAPYGPTTVVAATVPGAPTSVVATAGNTTAYVTWSAPASNGGSPITDYTVSSSPGGLTCTTTGVTTCTVTGLTTGTSYTFTVTATNAIGTGPASAPSNAVTTATVPGVPTGLSASGANGSYTVTLNWSAPSGNGSPITGYAIEYSQSSPSGPWASATANTGSTATSFALTLPSTTSFYWQVAAINAAGQGSWSSIDPVTWSVTGSYGYSYPTYGYVSVPTYGNVWVPTYGYVYVPTYGYVRVVYQNGGYWACSQYNGRGGCLSYYYIPTYGSYMSYQQTGGSYVYEQTGGYWSYQQTGGSYVYEQTGTTQVYEQTGTGYGTGYYYGWVG
jgi:hypothetical protein